MKKKKDNWWRKLKIWQKGGLIGFVFGLIFGSITFILSLLYMEGGEPLITWIFFGPLKLIIDTLELFIYGDVYMIALYSMPFICLLIGTLIGFIVDKLKK